MFFSCQFHAVLLEDFVHTLPSHRYSISEFQTVQAISLVLEIPDLFVAQKHLPEFFHCLCLCHVIATSGFSSYPQSSTFRPVRLLQFLLFPFHRLGLIRLPSALGLAFREALDLLNLVDGLFFYS